MSERLVKFGDVVAVLKKQWPWFTFSEVALAEYLGIEPEPTPKWCCCAEHHPNNGRCLQCPVHGLKAPGQYPNDKELQP